MLFIGISAREGFAWQYFSIESISAAIYVLVAIDVQGLTCYAKAVNTYITTWMGDSDQQVRITTTSTPV